MSIEPIIYASGFYDGAEDPIDYWSDESSENESIDSIENESHHSNDGSDIDSEDSESDNENDSQEISDNSDDEREDELASDRAFYKIYYKSVHRSFKEIYSVKSPTSIFEFLTIYNRLRLYDHIQHFSLMFKSIKDFKTDYMKKVKEETQKPIFNWSEKDEQSLRHILNHLKRYTKANYTFKVHYKGNPAIEA